MAKFITISGPSASGKTELWNELRCRLEKSGVVFMPDIFHSVWSELVESGLFYEEEEINKDAELLCCFVQRVINKYREYIDSYKDTDEIVVIDSCWIDISIYSTVNMWYTYVLKDVQESLLSQVSSYDDYLNRIYITTFNEEKYKVPKYHSRFKRYNLKFNRPLEIQYYELSSNFRNAVKLPDVSLEETVDFIMDDLSNLGYI